MKKIGLLNIQHIDNYGANLISYSMEREVGLVANDDAEVFTINFIPDRKKSFRQANTLVNMIRTFGVSGIWKKISALYKTGRSRFLTWMRKQKLFKTAKRILKRGAADEAPAADERLELNKRRIENFEIFHKQFLHLSETYSAENINKLDCDVIVVGSDVVWKPQRLLAQEENCAYFLSKIEKARGIAYAASIGISDEKILGRLGKRYKKAAGRFDHISLRERIAQSYMSGLMPDKQIENCIDPVFLRTAEEYERLIPNTLPAAEAYVYVYLMGNNDAACRFAEKLAAQKKLRIVFHTNHSGISFDGEPSLSDGPAEFLGRIKYADYVVTDTFHGTAFSIIFHKQFITFTRGNMSVRLEDFLSHIGLKERFVEYVEDTDRIDEPIDYEVIDSRIGEWVSASREWFRNALDLSLNNTTGGSLK